MQQLLKQHRHLSLPTGKTSPMATLYGKARGIIQERLAIENF